MVICAYPHQISRNNQSPAALGLKETFLREGSIWKDRIPSSQAANSKKPSSSTFSLPQTSKTSHPTNYLFSSLMIQSKKLPIIKLNPSLTEADMQGLRDPGRLSYELSSLCFCYWTLIFDSVCPQALAKRHAPAGVRSVEKKRCWQIFMSTQEVHAELSGLLSNVSLSETQMTYDYRYIEKKNTHMLN